MFDYEAVLPFPVLALLLWPANLVETTRGLFIVAVAIIALGQFMVLTRTFSQTNRTIAYFVANELLLVISVVAILGGQHVLTS